MDWQMIAAIAGGIVLIGNAGAVVYKWLRPALQIKKTVEELERRTVNDYNAIIELKETLKETEHVNRMHLVVLLNTVNHLIDGNGKDELKDTRNDIEKMLAGINSMDS